MAKIETFPAEVTPGFDGELTPEVVPFVVKPIEDLELMPGDEASFRVYDDGGAEVVVTRAGFAKRLAVRVKAFVLRQNELQLKGRGRL